MQDSKHRVVTQTIHTDLMPWLCSVMQTKLSLVTAVTENDLKHWDAASARQQATAR